MSYNFNPTNNLDTFIKPKGNIGIYLHKSGIWLPHANRLSNDAKIINEIHEPNLIVYSASTLMAQRMAPGSAPNVLTGNYIASGIQYLAVGRGALDSNDNPIWNLQSPPAPTLTTTKLAGELARKQFSSWNFLDSSGNISSTPTNVLQLITTFLEGEAVGPIVEMGLFGGDATSTADSGIMFNYKTFAVWNKPNDARLTIQWTLTF